MTTINKTEARAAGFRALTSRFYLPEEQEMLDGVLADMRRGNISHVLVSDRLGVAVWRRGRCMAGGGGHSSSPLACRARRGRAAGRRASRKGGRK